MEKAVGIRALYIIVNAGFADEAVEITREAGAGGATILNARGGGATLKMFMGISIEPEKEIVLCIVSAAVAEKIMTLITKRAGVKTPAHGVCFSIPVEKTAGISGFISPDGDNTNLQ